MNGVDSFVASCYLSRVSACSCVLDEPDVSGDIMTAVAHPK